MKTFDIDLTLERKKNSFPTLKDSLLYKVNPVKYDYQKMERIIEAEVFRETVPENQDMYHQSYLYYLQDSYAVHIPIVIAPHTIWYTIMCQIASEVVKNPEPYRDIFTSSKEKIEIIVDGSETEPLRMADIYRAMLPHVPIKDKLDVFFPELTTATENYKMAALAAFLETASPFYSYGMLACGFPKIKVDGTLEDWKRIKEHLIELCSIFGHAKSDYICDQVSRRYAPTIDQIIQAYEADDADFFKNIYYDERCGSGGDKDISGWILNFFNVCGKSVQMASDFTNCITTVPYFTLPSNTQWKMKFGLFSSKFDKDGFLVPDFSYYQLRMFDKPIREDMNKKPEFKIEKMTVNSQSRTIKGTITIEKPELMIIRDKGD